MIPEIESVSCVMLSISSRFSRVCLRTSYIRRPTGESGKIISGMTASETSASRQSRTKIVTTVVDHRRDVGHDRDQRSGDDVVDVVDVVGDAVHDLAGLRAGEERERHAVQVRDEARADVAHDPFADQRVQVALIDADRAARRSRSTTIPPTSRHELRRSCGIASSISHFVNSGGTSPSDGHEQDADEHRALLRASTGRKNAPMRRASTLRFGARLLRVEHARPHQVDGRTAVHRPLGDPVEVRIVAQREAEHEARAGLERHVAPVGTRDPAADRKPEAAPVGGGLLGEPFEDVVDQVRRDAGAVVFDRDERPLAVRAHGNVDRRHCITQRVVEQVAQQLVRRRSSPSTIALCECSAMRTPRAAAADSCSRTWRAVRASRSTGSRARFRTSGLRASVSRSAISVLARARGP